MDSRISEQTKREATMTSTALNTPEPAASARQLAEEAAAKLNVHIRMVVALVNVSERTFENWLKDEYGVPAGGKFKRLVMLHQIVEGAARQGVAGKDILQALNEPLDTEGRSILQFLWENPANQMLPIYADKHFKGLVGERTIGRPTGILSDKEKFRKEFGPLNEKTFKEAMASNPSLVADLVRSDDISVPARALALRALSGRPDVRAIDVIVKQLKHTSPVVQEAAVDALGSFVYHDVGKTDIITALQAWTAPTRGLAEMVQEILSED